MSDQKIRIKDLRDNIASAQALIDQARAHLDANRHLFTDEQLSLLDQELELKQFILDGQRRTLDREFPK